MASSDELKKKFCIKFEDVCRTNATEGSIFLSKIGKSRRLTIGEVNMLYEIFGKSLKYEKVLVVKGTFMPGQPDNVAMTPMGTIFFPDSVYQEDFSKGDIYDKHFFVHEMTHVWQFQKNENVFGKGAILSCGTGASNLIDGVEESLKKAVGDKNGASGKYSNWANPYIYDIAQNKKFSDYNLESRAEIIADFFAKGFNGAIGKGGKSNNSKNWWHEVYYQRLISQTGLLVDF